MKKLQLKIPVLLPQVPNEKDTCVQRLIEELEAKEGLDKVHIKDDQEDTVPQLCFHYDPDIILTAFNHWQKEPGLKLPRNMDICL